MATKPTSFPDWAVTLQNSPVTGEPNRDEPPSDKKDDGYDYQSDVPRQWLNWKFYNNGLWVRWFDQEVDSLNSTVGSLGTAAFESDTKYAHRSNNLSDLGDASVARNNLGLGSMALRAEGAFGELASINDWTARQDFDSGLSIGGGATISEFPTATASLSSGSYGENQTVLNVSVSGASPGDTVIVNGEQDNTGTALPVVASVVSAGTVDVKSVSDFSTSTSNTVYVSVFRHQ